MRPPLPPALARRVDRLARRAHAFHRWAHHPLCDRYAADVIPLGRRARLCRGCAFAAAGAAAGLALGLASPSVNGAACLAAAALLLAAVPAFVPTAPRGASGGRAPKLLSRFAPTALAGGAAGQALAAPSQARAAAAALGAAAVGWALLRYRRRGPDRTACAACASAPAGPRCPGLAPMVRRERAFSRLAARWIAAASAPRAGGPAGPERPSPDGG